MSKPQLIARVFCSKQVSLDDVVARVRAYYDTLKLDVDVAGEFAVFTRPGLTIHIERIVKLRPFLGEVEQLLRESAKARARRRSCVLRVAVTVSPMYDGRMLCVSNPHALSAGRTDVEVPDEAIGLVEFLGVTPGIQLEVFDVLTRRFLDETG